jgi:hypothetical protein
MCGALLDVAYNHDRLHVGAAMRELALDDCLMGALDNGLTQLATSVQGGQA